MATDMPKVTTPLAEPPHSIQAEQSVLGSLMLDSGHIDDVVDMLREIDFFQPQHQHIYAAIVNLHQRNQPCEPVAVHERLKDQGHGDDCGGLEYLGELTLAVLSADMVINHARIVHERSMLRQMFDAGQRISGSSLLPGDKESQELIQEAEQLLFGISEHGNSNRPQLAATFANSVVEQIDKFIKQGSGITGLSTGFSNLDALTTGLHQGDLIVVAGRPSMGKTSFAMNLIESAVLQSDKAAVVFSMEMASEQIVSRMFSSLGKVDQQHLRNGKITEEDWGAIQGVITKLDSMQLYIDDSNTLTPGEISSRTRKLVRNLPKGVQLGLVMIDYIQLMHMHTGRSSENRVNEVSEITRQLKALAKEIKVPVIALSQLSRSLESRQEKRPLMSDLRESGSIEQDADLIMFIYREGYYDKNSSNPSQTEINVAKQRNGPTDTINLVFENRFTRFKEGANSAPPPSSFGGKFSDYA